jgi:hypothetical protein
MTGSPDAEALSALRLWFFAVARGDVPGSVADPGPKASAAVLEWTLIASRISERVRTALLLQSSLSRTPNGGLRADEAEVAERIVAEAQELCVQISMEWESLQNARAALKHALYLSRPLPLYRDVVTAELNTLDKVAKGRASGRARKMSKQVRHRRVVEKMEELLREEPGWLPSKAADYLGHRKGIKYCRSQILRIWKARERSAE